MAMATWKMVWTNHDAVPVGEIDTAFDRKYTFRLNQPNTIEFKVPMESVIGRQIAAAPYGYGLVKLYRDGALQMVAETTSIQVLGKSGEKSVAVVATECAYPRFAAAVLTPAAPESIPPTTPTQAATAFMDRVAVHGSLLNNITIGSIGTTSSIDPSLFDTGTTFLDLLQALAFRASGFDFWFTPVSPVPTAGNAYAVAQFNAAAIKGTTKPNAVFEYGANSRANVDEYTLTALAGDQLCNTAIALGPSTSTQGGPAVSSDSASAAIFGGRERFISTDIELSSLRSDLAVMHVLKRAYPRLMLTLTPSPSDGTGAVPQFITDYDIGDIVPAKVIDNGTNLISANVRIYGVAVSLDLAGMETIELTLNSDTTA